MRRLNTNNLYWNTNQYKPGQAAGTRPYYGIGVSPAGPAAWSGATSRTIVVVVVAVPSQQCVQFVVSYGSIQVTGSRRRRVSNCELVSEARQNGVPRRTWRKQRGATRRVASVAASLPRRHLEWLWRVSGDAVLWDS